MSLWVLREPSHHHWANPFSVTTNVVDRVYHHSDTRLVDVECRYLWPSTRFNHLSAQIIEMDFVIEECFCWCSLQSLFNTPFPNIFGASDEEKSKHWHYIFSAVRNLLVPIIGALFSVHFVVFLLKLIPIIGFICIFYLHNLPLSHAHTENIWFMCEVRTLNAGD